MAEGAVADRIGGLRIDRSRRLSGRRSRRLLLAAALLVLAALAIAGALARRAPIVTVAPVREARPGEAATELSAAGYVASRRRSIVAPQIPGRLEEVLVEEGERVEEGQLLARLDDSDARAALAQARAEQLSIVAQAAAAEASAQKAERDLQRTAELVEQEAVRALDLPDARTASEAAAAQARAARARVRAATEAVAGTQLRLDHTRVHAPFAGTVVKKLAEAGAVLAPAAIEAPNAGGIVELVDLEALEVEAEVSEEQLRQVRPGQPALIFLDAFPDRTFRAEAGSVRPAVDRSKATAVVNVTFVDRPVGVLPDMGAKVAFLSEELPEDALAKGAELRVPATAVVQRDGRQVVFVLEEGRARAAPVEVGERRGEEVALLQGPAPGSPVVAAPGPKLADGARVKARETKG